MSFWSGNKIAVELNNPHSSTPIVSEYSENQINESAYTLRMGEQYFVTPDHNSDRRSSHRKSLKAAEIDSNNNQTKSACSFVVPSGQFAYLLTEEWLNIPDNVMCFISMKANFKLRGLINVSGFHVDPGFTGKLVFSIYNAGPSDITVTRGEELFLIWFTDLCFPEGCSEEDIKKFSRHHKPPQRQISDSQISDINTPIYSLQSLSHELKKVDDIKEKILKIEAFILSAKTIFAITTFSGVVFTVVWAILKNP